MLHEDLEFWRGAPFDASFLNGLISAAPLGSPMAVSAYVVAAYGHPPLAPTKAARLDLHRIQEAVPAQAA
jgi:hypothetical protein